MSCDRRVSPVTPRNPERPSQRLRGSFVWLVRSAAEPGLEQLLALFSALAALGLRLAEQVGEFAVAVAVGVLDVGLQAERVAQALLGEPDEVVVLVLGAGDLSGLLAATSGHGPLLCSS